MNHTLIRTPHGEEMVLLSKADFDAMQDALQIARHDRTMADIAAGRQEWLSADDVERSLSEPTPLAFWRKKRGVTQTALSATVGISKSYMSGLESGNRKGDPALLLRLARALQVRMEDLVVEE
jgi:DNA-binding XRE family transcriptional regulator